MSEFIKSKFEFVFSFAFSFAAWERRRLDKIPRDVIWTIICLKISFLISRVIIILLNTECASTMMKAWLCFEFLISKLHESEFSSTSLTMIEKEHFICLLSSWRRFCLVHSCDFRPRSHIIQTLLLTPSLNFLIRLRTTA